MSALAIIPARGGSKRIPRKNIRPFCGKPIIAYSIEAALQSRCFDEVMVSTDDEEIADLAKQYGAKVPFFRSKEASSDNAGIAEVLLEVVNEYEKKKIFFEYLCSIMATAPFLTPDLLREGYQIITIGQVNSITPVVKFGYPVQRALFVKENRLSMCWPENYTLRSQDCAPYYHDAGLFDFVRIDALKHEKRLFCERAGAVVVPEYRAQDIDTEEDWRLAEFKYCYFSRTSQ